MKAIVIFILILCLLLVIFTIDYLLGKRSAHRQTSLIKVNEKGYSNFSLFVHGSDLFADFFSEIRNAQKSIIVLFYIVKNDGLSKQFLNLLIKKASEGLDVYLLVDWFGSRKISRKKLKDFQAAGGKFAFANKPRLPFLFYSLQVRNHRKIAVIDGEIGYLGGYNIGDDYIDKNPQLSPWRDYHLKITGSGIAPLYEQFKIDWKRATNQPFNIRLQQEETLLLGKAAHELVATEGITLEHTYETLINNARQSIFIGTPYFIPSEKILQALLNSMQRGITVTILVPKVADHRFVKEASLQYMRILLKHGAKIYEYGDGFYHAKVMLIDNKMCNIGTANFDRRSFFINYEINCYIYDKDFIEKVNDVITIDLEQSDKLTIERTTSQIFAEKVNEQIAKLITPFL